MHARIVAVLLVSIVSFASVTNAQPRPDRQVGATVTWTIAGAGAGFGIGLWAGLAAFDDAINSDRKVWTSALAGAAIGGGGGYLISRARRSKGPAVAPAQGAGFGSTRVGSTRVVQLKLAQLKLSPTGEVELTWTIPEES